MPSSSNSGNVAIFAIMVLAMLGAFIAWQAGVFGEGERRDADVELRSGETRK